MGVVKLSTAEITQYQKYSNFLAGNPAYFPPAYEHIQTINPNNAQAAFTSIPQDYQHLQIRMIARSTRPSTENSIVMYVNNNRNKIYTRHIMFANGSTVNGFANAPDYDFVFFGDMTAANSTSGAYSSYVIDILDYKTGKNKTIRWLGGMTLPNNQVFLGSALARETNAITRLDVEALGFSFASGTRISLYGLKAS